MAPNNLHPDIQAFKTFINHHPKLIESIRKSGQSWQTYYEKWVLLGEEDPYWDDFKSNSQETTKQSQSGKQTEMLEHLKKLSENMDLNKIQSHAQQLSGTIGTVQELISQFQNTKGSPKPHDQESVERFNWFKD